MDSSKILPAQRKLRRNLLSAHQGALIISIPAICLFASLLAIAGGRAKSIAARKQEQQSRQIILETNRLLKTLVDSETGVRGYVITKRPEFLKPYLEAKSLLPNSLNSFSDRMLLNPTQRQQFQQIPTLARQQITLLEQIRQTSERLGATRIASPTLTEQLLESKLLMDNLRSRIAEFSEQAERSARDREAETVWWRQLTTLIQWSSLGIGMLASGVALYLFYQLDQKLAERTRRLSDSNTYLNSVFDNVVDGILILNERGYIQSANATAVEMFGYEPNELLSKHLQRLIAEPFMDDSGKVMSQLIGKNQDKLRLQQETVGCQKSGKTFPMEFVISEMPLDNEHQLIVIVRDITERLRSQETLLKQAQLLDLANDSIMVRDLNDTITYWNQGAERLYGFSSSEAVGQSAHTLLKAEFAQPLPEIKQVVFEDGYWSGEVVHSRRDGTRVVVQSGLTLQRDESKPIAYLEINQDITELKQSEAALRQSEELYRTLVKNFPNGAVFLFDQDLRYNIADGTALATVKLNSAALTGKTIWEALPTETTQVLEPIYRDALAGKGTVTEIPFANHLYRIYVLPVVNQQGEVVSGLAMMQDITESKKVEEALRSRAEELARMTAVLAQTTTNLEKRNTELDQFAYIVSHDLKAPLRAIANLSQWLEEDLEEHLTADTRHQMDLLRGRVHRMEALINALLEYSRVGRLRNQLELVDVAALLNDVIDSLAPPPNTVKVMPGMPTLMAERLPLEQVFANLISNGIKHNHRPDGQIVISATDKTDVYEFAVADNGPGIAPEFHQKVFVMFQTLEPRDKVENTGIGLAIVKKIIEDKGGTISLESALGQGARFRFTWRKQPLE